MNRRSLWGGTATHSDSSRIRRHFLIGAGALLGIGVCSIFVSQLTERPGYRPALDYDQLDSINSRVARPGPCSLKEMPQYWPRTASEDLKSRFRTQVLALSASAGTVGIVEIDRDVVETAIQIVFGRGSTMNGASQQVRTQADHKLFKPNTRAFILIGPGRHFVIAEEPMLLAEHQTEGRLVGISRGAALDSVRILVFEDRVCRDDASFAIKIPSFLPEETLFHFGNESDILKVIALKYGSVTTVPLQNSYTDLAERKIEQELQERAALKDLANDLVGLIQSL
jgi:hypothetical protein